MFYLFNQFGMSVSSLSVKPSSRASLLSSTYQLIPIFVMLIQKTSCCSVVGCGGLIAKGKYCRMHTCKHHGCKRAAKATTQVCKKHTCYMCYQSSHPHPSSTTYPCPTCGHPTSSKCSGC